MTTTNPRRLGRADAEAWLGLQRLAVRTEPLDFSWLPTAQRAAATLSIGSRHVWGAFVGSTLVGMVRCEDGDVPAEAHITRVHGLFVRMSQRGHGIASLLLENALAAEAAAGKALARLIVLEGNPASVLYRQAGFDVVASIPDSVRIGGAARARLVMDRALSAS